MTIFEHPLWPTLLSYLYLDKTGTVNGPNPEHRTEVHKTAPPAVFDIVVECAHCHAPIHAVRFTKRKIWTFNVSCPLKVNYVCARMPETRAVKDQVREAMLHAPPPVGSLFALFEDDDDPDDA